MARNEPTSQVDRVARAEESAVSGDHDGALRILDDVLASPGHEGIARAVQIASAIYAHRGMLDRSADLYRHVPSGDLGDNAAAAALTLIGIGDVDGARAMLEAAAPGSPAAVAAGMRAMARGIEKSITGDGSTAFSALVQAAASMAPVGRDVILQDTPASLAAIVSLHVGELDLAASVLHRAIEADLGGRMFRDRHQVLLAWTAMLGGDLPQASSLVASIGDDHADVRNSLFAHGVRVGVARRNSDISALAEAWAGARGVLPGHTVDLYMLLPLGELAVAASRLRDDHRIATQLDSASKLLETLDNPPLWSAAFHWYGVQSAILTERPSDLIPHADALVRAAQVSRHAGLLANAGQTWLRILQDDVDPLAVRTSVQDLDGIGLSWDASRLAAQAAARTTDRQAMLDLLNAARSVQRFSTSSLSPAVSGASADGERSGNLTDREWEIARLVVERVGYREIGERLFISPKTVEHHVASIRRRLGSENRQEMLATLRRLVDSVET